MIKGLGGTQSSTAMREPSFVKFEFAAGIDFFLRPKVHSSNIEELRLLLID
jgi:hypothetical protein